MKKSQIAIALAGMALFVSSVFAEGVRTTTRTGEREGGRARWTAQHQRGERTAVTEGEGRRTENGRAWRSETTFTDRKGETRTLVTNGTATRTVSYDGYPVIHRQWTRVRDDGTTVTGSSETLVTPGPNGRSWETTGSRTGPRDTTDFTGSGTSTRTENGSTWRATRQATDSNGREWTSQTTGTSTRTENGRRWTSETRANR